MLERRTDSPDQSVEEVFQAYGNMLYRIAFVMMKNAFDAEDVVQDTLIKYMEHTESGKLFETEEHRKAWLIRVDINLCKNRLRFYVKEEVTYLIELDWRVAAASGGAVFFFTLSAALAGIYGNLRQEPLYLLEEGTAGCDR